jgi:hypothetical protein
VTRYDPGPAIAQARLAVLEHDEPPTADNLAAALGVNRRSLQRYRTGAQQLRPHDADAIAVRLGLHPANLWPEWWTA